MALQSPSPGSGTLLGSAWWVVGERPRPAQLPAFVWARMTRDAGAELLPFSHVGGLVIGMAEGGMSISQALNVFTKLTIGDGLVSQVPDDSLLVAELKETVRDGRRFKGVSFSCLSDTWRAHAEETIKHDTRKAWQSMKKRRTSSECGPP